jgi:hypothetical protein
MLEDLPGFSLLKETARTNDRKTKDGRNDEHNTNEKLLGDDLIDKTENNFPTFQQNIILPSDKSPATSQEAFIFQRSSVFQNGNQGKV